MNNDEKYLFDLNGYLVIEDVLTPDEVARANEAIDRHQDQGCIRTREVDIAGLEAPSPDRRRGAIQGVYLKLQPQGHLILPRQHHAGEAAAAGAHPNHPSAQGVIGGFRVGNQLEGTPGKDLVPQGFAGEQLDARLIRIVFQGYDGDPLGGSVGALIANEAIATSGGWDCQGQYQYQYR